MTTDLFGSSDVQLKSTKWSIGKYLSSQTGYRPASLTNVQGSDETSDSIKIELERAIASINSTYNRSSMDFDKIFKDLATRRKELKALMTELQATAKPVDVAALWSVESNLITSQMRALENKQKIEAERFKQIRDEKKLAKDRGGNSNEPQNGNSAGVTNIITNSPLGNSEQLSGTSIKTAGYDISSLPASMLLKNKSKYAAAEPAEVVKPQPAAIEVKEKNEELTIPPVVPQFKEVETVTTAEQPVVASPSDEIIEEAMVTTEGPSGGNDGDIVVTSDLAGLHPVTVNDVTRGLSDRVMNRLKHAEESLDINTITGYNLNTSLKTLAAKSVPHKEVVYVAPDGRYYVKAYEISEDGNDIEMTNYPYKSLTHLGSLSFNPLHKQVTYYYYPDPKAYVLVDSMDGSPEFYKTQWNDIKNEKYILDTDTVNTLFESK